MNRKFDRMTEAEKYIKETFKNYQEGCAYYGRIIVKSKVHGFDTSNNNVKVYSNRGRELYLINKGSSFIVVREAPEMAWII